MPPRRRTAVLALVLALAGTLVACRKPAPSITVYGDGRSVQVPAAFYQQPDGPTRNYSSDYDQAPSITVRAGTRLLVDVPGSVAGNAWLVAAVRVGQDNQRQAIDGAGSGAIRNRHTVRVDSTPAGVGTYFLQVGELRGSTQPVGGWVLKVHTTS